MFQDRLSTGIPGLDQVLYGGLVSGRAYLVRGGPGTGKTTLGLHFLTASVANSEQSLYITLGEPAEQIRTNAEAVGFDINKVTFLDLSPTSEFFTEIQTYDIFSPAEVEREPTTQKIIELAVPHCDGCGLPLKLTVFPSSFIFLLNYPLRSAAKNAA